MRAQAPCSAPTLLAAALAGVYLIWAPPSQDLAAADLPRRPVRRPRVRDLEQRLVLGPLPALLQRPLPAARGAARPAPDRGARGRSRRRRCSRSSPAAGSAPLRMVPSLWFAAAVAAWLLTGRVPVPARRPVRPRARCSRSTRPGAGLGRGARGASQPRQPGRGPVRRRSPAPRCCSPASAPAAPAWRSERRSRSRVLNLAFPTGGVRAVRVLRLHRDPAARGGRRLARSAASTGRCGSAPSSTRCSRSPCSSSTTPLGGNVTRLGALFAGPVLALVLWPRGRWVVLAVSLPLLYWQLVAPVRDVRKAAGDPSTERAFYEPAARRARPPRRRRRAVPDRGPADQEPLGGGLRRPRAPDRPRLAAPARVRRLRPVHRREPRRGRLSRLARRPRGRLRRRLRRARSTTSPRTRSR